MKTISVRLAAANEIEPALRLLFGHNQQPADEQLVKDFIADARQRQLSLKNLRICVDSSRIVWAALPIASAGRTAVLVEPNQPLPRRIETAARQLIADCCADLKSAAVQIVQALLDPADDLAARLHANCGFEPLAILEYLRLPAATPATPLPDDLELRSSPPDADLATALRLSYIDTLDCPRLNGLRSLPDIIEGYRQAHPFDPTLWHVLYRAQKPVGVLLLSAPSDIDSLELSYLGLAPAVRGKGLGATLVSMARSIAAARGSSELAVTVDSQNEPAKRLYFRAGGRVILSRQVMIRVFDP